MNPYLFHPYVVTGYLTAVTTLIIGLFVFLKNKKSPIHRAFLIYSLAIVQWAFFTALQGMQTDSTWALVWGRFCHVGVLLIPSFFYYFTTKITGKENGTILKIGFIISFASIIPLLITPYFIPKEQTDAGINLPSPGPLYIGIIIFFCIYVVLSLVHLWNERCQSSGLRRKHLDYFFWASAIGYGVGVVNFFPVYSITFFPYPYSAACGSIYFLVLGYAIMKHRFLDIELIIKRGLIFAVLFLSVYLAVSLLIFGISLPFTKTPDSVLSGLSIALAMLIYEPLKAVLTRLTNRFLFQKKTAYTQLVHTLTQKLARIKDSASLAGEITDFLTREMNVEWAALYLEDQHGFQLRSSHGFGFIRPSDAISKNLTAPLKSFDSKHMIPNLLRNRKGPFLPSPFDMEGELTPELKETLRREKIEALVPIFVERNLYGILLLGKKKSDDDFTAEDGALLKTVMDEVGMFFLSAKLLKEATRSGLELGQRMKMASVKKLARGVHHEVRNPLHAMDLTAEMVLENLRKGRYQEMGTDGFALEIKTRAKEMLKDIERIKNSLSRFAQFARPDEDFELKPLSLKDELEKFLALMREGQKLDKIKVHSSVNGESVLASEGVLQEILFNLFNNAFEAMHGTGELFISTESNGEFVEIKFKDTGPGIPKDVMANIFEPYFTTKQDSESVGIGLSIVKHHMERLGGAIKVSDSDGGAEFQLKFRKAEQEAKVAKPSL